ncbi:MAG: radical SAM family heme chaperone HemW [Paracoccaceae bacterium]
MADWQKGGFGLYLHWPFCQAKCPYCDFNSHVVDTIDQARWKSAYLAEIARAAAETPGRILDSIYFGGGTPSLMDPDLVAAILDTIRRHWRVVNDLEITLEANPTSVEAGRFRGYHDAGVNRISMGIQALDDTSLRALGRLHSVADAWKAYDIARDTFARVSFDLIYARQNQTLNDWQRELNEALSMAADHLSLYQLTIEDGTAFGARLARGKLPGLPNEDLAADMYFLTQQMTERAGLPAYEVSNHAASGQESRHNLVYWRGGDYVGIGPGAHGRLTFDGTRHATETHLAPARWLTAVENNGTGETLRDPISPRDQGDELMMMGLRLHEGIELARYNDITGNDLTKQINDLTDLGLVTLNDGRLMLTPAGRPLLNAILRQLLA